MGFIPHEYTLNLFYTVSVIQFLPDKLYYRLVLGTCVDDLQIGKYRQYAGDEYFCEAISDFTMAIEWSQFKFVDERLSEKYATAYLNQQ